MFVDFVDYIEDLSSRLENRGFIKEAAMLDIVANTWESRMASGFDNDLAKFDVKSLMSRLEVANLMSGITMAQKEKINDIKYWLQAATRDKSVIPRAKDEIAKIWEKF